MKPSSTFGICAGFSRAKGIKTGGCGTDSEISGVKKPSKPSITTTTLGQNSAKASHLLRVQWESLSHRWSCQNHGVRTQTNRWNLPHCLKLWFWRENFWLNQIHGRKTERLFTLSLSVFSCCLLCHARDSLLWLQSNPSTFWSGHYRHARVALPVTRTRIVS